MVVDVERSCVCFWASMPCMAALFKTREDAVKTVEYLAGWEGPLQVRRMLRAPWGEILPSNEGQGESTGPASIARRSPIADTN